MQLNTLGVIHDFLRRTVQPGSFCIDATAGKGRDTALLCRLAGPTGTVLSFDIQPQAIAATQELLAAQGLSAQVFLESHTQMEAHAAPETVDCVVFNLGRLPGGDPKIFTQAHSTLAAVDAALRLLKPGGVLAIALYYGGRKRLHRKRRPAGAPAPAGRPAVHHPPLRLGQPAGRAAHAHPGVEGALTPLPAGQAPANLLLFAADLF